MSVLAIDLESVLKKNFSVALFSLPFSCVGVGWWLGGVGLGGFFWNCFDSGMALLSRSLCCFKVVSIEGYEVLK